MPPATARPLSTQTGSALAQKVNVTLFAAPGAEMVSGSVAVRAASPVAVPVTVRV